jgi:hypothetical protein
MRDGVACIEATRCAPQRLPKRGRGSRSRWHRHARIPAPPRNTLRHHVAIARLGRHRIGRRRTRSARTRSRHPMLRNPRMPRPRLRMEAELAHATTIRRDRRIDDAIRTRSASTRLRRTRHREVDALHHRRLGGRLQRRRRSTLVRRRLLQRRLLMRRRRRASARGDEEDESEWSAHAERVTRGRQ